MSATYRSRPRRRSIAGASRRAGLLAILSALLLLVGQFVASADPPDEAADQGRGAQVSQEHATGSDSTSEESTSGEESEATSGRDSRSEHDPATASVRGREHLAGQADASGSALLRGGGSSKITICHATASVRNPYVEITVSVAAADGIAGASGNQADHFGEHQGPIFDPEINVNGDHWGDIIPDVDDDGNQMPHDGLNWDAEGRAILAAGCVIAAPSPSPSPSASASPSAGVLGRTATPTPTRSGPQAPTQTAPSGIAFTGPGDGIVGFALLSISLLLLGMGALYAGYRRGARGVR